MKGTGRDVLSQLECWLNDEQDKRVLWLNSLAGTRKSTVAQTFAEISFADGKLGASLFCSRISTTGALSGNFSLPSPSSSPTGIRLFERSCVES